jgi:hypothetical protein
MPPSTSLQTFDMFVSSKAVAADKIRGVWKINVNGKFKSSPAVKTSCAGANRTKPGL